MKYAKKLVILPAERYNDMLKRLQENSLSTSVNNHAVVQQKGMGEQNEPGVIPGSTQKLDESPISDVIKEQNEEPVIKEHNGESQLDIEQISNTLGKPYRHKAKELLKLIKRTGPDTFTWTNDGEIINNGNLVKGSNIIDLIRCLMYKTCNGMNTVGYEELEKLLNQMNVPLTLIGNVNSRAKLFKLKDGLSNNIKIKKESQLKKHKLGDGKRGRCNFKSTRKWISL